MILFVDFEASSLMRGSFPIEIGWCGDDGVGEAHLIRPADGWDEWSSRSEEIHGISREQLFAEGGRVGDVAHRFLEAARGAEAIYCDGGGLDQVWLNRLTSAAGVSRITKLTHVEDLYGREIRRLFEILPEPHRRFFNAMRKALAFEGVQLVADTNEAELLRDRIRHRALPDAQALQWTWQEVRRRVDERLCT